MKKILRKIPILGPLLVKAKRKMGGSKKFETTEQYWNERYSSGGTSGQGSYHKFAQHKADVLNDFVLKNDVNSVLELGCGDGNQISYFNFPKFMGYEVSQDAVKMCQERFKDDSSKSFFHFDDFKISKHDLAISLDVVYCLVEEDIYHQYLERLFDCSNNYVIIFSSNFDKIPENVSHIRHRKFTDWIAKNRSEFKQIDFIENKFAEEVAGSSHSDFYIFQKVSAKS